MTTTGPIIAGTGADALGSGPGIWTNPGNVTANDTTYATIGVSSMASPLTSNYLLCTNFGFSIASDQVIDGIEVTTGRFADVSLGTGGVVDDSVRLVIGGSVSGSDIDTGAAWSTSLTPDTIGSSTSLGELTPTYSDINSSGFGVAIKCVVTATTVSVTAKIDWVKISVHHHTADLDTRIADADIYLEDDQLSADATVAISGNSEVTIDDDLVESGATAAVILSGESSLSDFQLTSSVSVEITANLDIILEDNQSPEFYYKLTETLDDFLLAADGTSAIVADASISSDDATSEASTSWSGNADVVATEEDDSLSASAGVIVGTTVSNVNEPTQLTAGAVTMIGLASSIPQANVSVSSTTSWDIALNGSPVLADGSLSASASVLSVLDGAATENADRLTATSKTIVGTSGGGTEFDDRSSASIQNKVTIRVAATLDSFSMVASLGTSYISLAGTLENEIGAGSVLNVVSVAGSPNEVGDVASGSASALIVSSASCTEIGDRVVSTVGAGILTNGEMLLTNATFSAFTVTTRPLTANIVLAGDRLSSAAAIGVSVQVAMTQQAIQGSGASVVSVALSGSASQQNNLGAGSNSTKVTTALDSRIGNDRLSSICQALDVTSLTQTQEPQSIIATSQIGIQMSGSGAQSSSVSANLIVNPSLSSLFKSKVFQSSVFRRSFARSV